MHRVEFLEPMLVFVGSAAWNLLVGYLPCIYAYADGNPACYALCTAHKAPQPARQLPRVYMLSKPAASLLLHVAKECQVESRRLVLDTG